MVSQKVNRIYEALTEAERQELRELLERRSVESADERRRQHRRRDFQPIEMPGGSLSEELIRDRR